MGLEASPFQAGVVDYSLPGGSVIVAWEPFGSRWTGAGWALTQPDTSTRFTTGFVVPGAVKAVWADTAFEAAFDAPFTFSLDQRWGPWVWGGTAISGGGTIRTLEPVDFGSLEGRGWTAWGGTESLAAFYGEFSAEVAAARNVLVWSFDGQGKASGRWGGLSSRGLVPLGWGILNWEAAALYGEVQVGIHLTRNVLGQGQWTTNEDSRVRATAFWLDSAWQTNGWTVALGTGTALFWVENPTWTQIHSWTETVWWPPPFYVTKTSQTNYTLEASPGWVVLLHPRLSYRFFPGATLELSSWVPVAVGILAAIDDDPQASPGPPRGVLVPPTWNLWLPGIQINLTSRW
jgi:hypothetical protein